jgi:hypothetical protein
MNLVRIARLGCIVAAAILGYTASAWAAKWHECPSPLGRTYTSRTGAVNAPFVHPGHEIGIVLSDTEKLTTGGFSTEPEGNTVRIEFASLFGDRITLPDLRVAAVSPATLYFTFPDTRTIVGRALAGPVEVHIMNGEDMVAHVLPRTLLALPPPLDVAGLMSGSDQQDALGTMDARGAIWIPIQFSGFGKTDMEMPGCPSDFTPLGAFAMGVQVRANGPDGGSTSYPPFRGLRRAEVYLGDFLIHGGNAYGSRLRNRLRLLRMPRGFGVGICGVNDAIDLVLRVRGRRRWARPGSRFDQWVADSSPLPITLSNASAEPELSGRLEATRFDAFGSQCEFAAPPHH